MSSLSGVPTALGPFPRYVFRASERSGRVRIIWAYERSEDDDAYQIHHGRELDKFWDGGMTWYLRMVRKGKETGWMSTLSLGLDCSLSLAVILDGANAPHRTRQSSETLSRTLSRLLL